MSWTWSSEKFQELKEFKGSQKKKQRLKQTACWLKPNKQNVSTSFANRSDFQNLEELTCLAEPLEKKQMSLFAKSATFSKCRAGQGLDSGVETKAELIEGYPSSSEESEADFLYDTSPPVIVSGKRKRQSEGDMKHFDSSIKPTVCGPSKSRRSINVSISSLAPTSVVEQKENITIDTFDSDSDNDNLNSPTSSIHGLPPCDTDSSEPEVIHMKKIIEIEDFESDDPSEDEEPHKGTQFSVDDSSLTSSVTLEPKLLTTDTDVSGTEKEGVDVKQEPVDSAKKRKRYLKDGLAEQLQKLISRERYNNAFWRHSKQQSLDEKVFGSVDDAKSLLHLRIIKEQSEFGLNMFTCETLDCQRKTLFIILPNHVQNQLKLLNKKFLKVHPPWKKIQLSCFVEPVLLCAYNIEAFLNGPSIDIQSEQAVHSSNVGEALHSNVCPVDLSSVQTHLTLDMVYEPENLTLKVPSNGLISSSIINSVADSGYTKPISFCARIEKVYFKIGCVYTYDSNCFRSISAALKKIKVNMCGKEKETQASLVLLVQDKDATFAEIVIPEVRQLNAEIVSEIKSERQIMDFIRLRLTNVKKEVKCSPLFCLIDSVQKNHVNQSIDSIISETSDQTWSQLFCYQFKVESCSVLARGNHSNAFSEVEAISDPVIMFPCSTAASLPSDNLPYHYISLYAKCFAYYKADRYRKLFIFSPLPPQDDNTESFINLIHVLPECHFPRFIEDHLHLPNSILFIKDLIITRENPTRLLANAYTVITVVTAKSQASVFANSSDLLQLLSITVVDENKLPPPQSCKIPAVRPLSTDTRIDELVSVTGRIVGVNEETAVFWTVCNQCETESIIEQENGGTYCTKCDCATEEKMQVHLELFLHVPDFPGQVISIQLLQSTVFNILPEPDSNDFQGYDIKCILEKKFGPTLCYLKDVKKSSEDPEKQGTQVRLQEVVSAQSTF